MLSSIVIAFFAGRLSTHTEQSTAVVQSTSRFSSRALALEFLTWSLVVLTASALLWVVAPYVVSAVHRFCPSAGAYLTLTPPHFASAAECNWFIVKRVMVGYFGLCVAALLVFAFWFAVHRRFSARLHTGVTRWSVILDEQGDE
ncbi:hypothetical protein [Paraburkholderia dioscoreae]|uniref:Transmembrane protein n=1 Tax=Paraburkholderia dioscoreae TaxID=2604047 RepID=A0A5Q4ZEA1_9BURK|nr:hypothetical protein [Paraburkholderia dioscoreae]VVD30993.1 conserved protein of unknown function [Paraburkholderia dioscoreae]